MILLDTCALIWTVNGDPVAPKALKEINRARNRGTLFLSPISAWEIGILARRGRLKLDVPAELYIRRAFSHPGVRIAALTPEVAVRASYLPGDFHFDPADRLLISTAILTGLKLVTRDREILHYANQGFVSALGC